MHLTAYHSCLTMYFHVMSTCYTHTNVVNLLLTANHLNSIFLAGLMIDVINDMLISSHTCSF